MSDASLILVVDDDPDLCELVRRTLVGDGYQVDTAADGAAAVMACRMRLPDVLLLDLMMPQMDGEQCARAIRLEHGDRTPPIVLLSASRVRDQIAEAIGALAVIEKPFDLDDLRDAVSHACSVAASRRSERRRDE